MIIKSIVFENYKSFKNNTYLKFNKGITTVIGKNEAGKSNLINLLGAISLDKAVNKDIFSKWNRERLEESCPITIKLEINKEEATNFKVQETESIITIQKENTNHKISGFLQEYFSIDLINNLINDLNISEEILNKKLNITEKKTYRSTVSFISLCQSTICYNFESNIKTIDKLLKKLFQSSESIEKYKDYHIRLENFLDYYNNMYKELPSIYLYKEEMLKNSYRLDNNFFDKYNTQFKSIRNFISATGLNQSVFQEACNTSDIGIRQDRLTQINTAIKKNIEKPFNDFYQQEKVSFEINIQGTLLFLLVKSSDQSITISERSNGLRWYFNLYLALKAKNIENKTVLFLIDEPGVHLHIDAQKHLIEFFNDLSNKHQVVYTTHSPFMIEVDRLEQIRVIIKKHGVSYLYNSIHDPNIKGVSKQETLSPIVKSIGLSMASDFSIFTSPFSIITEGKLDVKYLTSFDASLKKDFKFISCIGAPNILNVSSILLGWGCNFLILLDHDKEGIRTKKKLLDKNIPKNIIVFISDGMNGKISNEFEVEDLISESDYSLLGYDYNNLEDEKTQAAIKFQEFMRSNKASAISNKTSQNFTGIIKLLREKKNHIINNKANKSQ